MKKLLGIMVLGLLFFSNANAMPKWIGKAIKVCRANQDIDLSMVWFYDNGSVEEKIDFSLKKGDYVTLNRRTNKDQKWYVASNNYFPAKNSSWAKLEVRGRYEKVRIKDFLIDCKKIKYLKVKYKSYTANSFNEIFNNKYSSKPVKLSGQLYLPKKKGKFPVVYLQHGTANPKSLINFFQKVIDEMHKENIAGGTNLTMGNADVLTVTGNTITSTNIKFSNATSQLILNGSAVTITGDINATSDTASGIITLNGAKTTFTGNIGAASGTTVLIMTIAAAKRAVITETANFIDSIDFGAAAELEITKAVTGGSVFTMDSTLMENTDVADVKILMPVNLVGGETLILFATAADEASMLANIKSGLSDTALIDYSATNSSGTYTVTATAKSAATTASELGVTTNYATAYQQALLAVVSDTNVDGTAEDAFYNALQAEGDYSATEDTSLANQVGVQTDGIVGSTSATRAMTGTVQGIVSNRMASLRSGDAYVTGVAAGYGMSTNSGFLQVFGADITQKNNTVGSGTEYGYGAETKGYALGFDGITDNGSVIGLSLSRSNTDVTGKGTGKSTNDIESYTASIYADKVTDNGYLEGSLTFGINDNATSRIVNTAGLARTYKGSYDSGQVSLKIGGGVPKQMNNGAFITPFGSIAGTLILTDTYTETSTTASDNLRLKIALDDVTSIVGSLGFKAHIVTNKGTPMISLAINNEFGDNTINSTNTYTGGGSAFTTSTKVEELSATLGLGYSYGSDRTSLNLGYEAEANQKDYLSHYGTLKLVHKF